MKPRLLIGTNNPSKLQYIKALIDPDVVECVSPADLKLSIDAVEDARDAAGNALQKAIQFHRASGLPVITEDSGLVFLDLPFDHPDQPGVHVRRPAGVPPLTDDEDMLRYYCQVITRHGGSLRAAWQDAWCILLDEKHYAIRADDETSMLSGAMTLVDVPCNARNPGWPLDSLSISSINGKYWAELSHEEKAEARRLNATLDEDRRALMEWITSQIRKLESV